MPIWQLCANLLIPNCLRSNLSYSPLAALELYVTFGYTWDFTSKMIKRLRLSLTAQNVFCITGYSGVDPEVALSGLEPGMESLSYYPRTTEFTFGVNIVF